EVIQSVAITRKEHVRLEIVLVRSESQPAGDKLLSSAAQFSDSPNFTIAGVTDWNAAGGHGSDATLRTSEAFARETHGLGTETSREIASTTGPVDSESNLRAALRRSPQSFAANRRLGEFYLRSQRYDQAIPMLEAAYRIQPQDLA